MRVPLPPRPAWLKLFEGPRWLPLGAIVHTGTPVATGMILALALPAGGGYILMLLCFVIITWQALGKALVRRFIAKYAESDEGRAAAEAAQAAWDQVQQEEHAAIDWLTRVANGADSPFKDLGFDSTVGLLVLVRRDQRVPKHDDKWICQTFFNTLPAETELTMATAAVVIHELAHTMLATHEAQMARTVEVRT